MWNRVNVEDLVTSIMIVTGNSRYTVEKFLEFVSFLGHTEYDLIKEANGWCELGDQERTDTAKKYTGVYNMSQFYVLMDCLANKEGVTNE